MENPPIAPIGSRRRLADLAQQLRLYRAPLCPLDYDDDDLDSANVGRLRFRTAAVLVCIFEDTHGDLRVILTKRSSNLHTSPGEISLPGGKFEEGDEDEQMTALREAKEEIGLPPELVSFVAVLEPVFTKVRLIRVVPVVCVLNDKDAFQPVLNPAEVEELLDVPLEMFLKDDNRRGEEREWHGIKYLLHYFDYAIDDKKYVIWGLTSNVLIRAASVVYQRLPSFTEQDPSYRDSIVEEIRKLLRSQPY